MELINKKNGLIVVALGLFCLFCIGRIKQGKLKLLDVTTSYFVYPILVTQNYLIQPIKQMVYHYKSYQQLQNEYKKVHEKYLGLLDENVSLQSQLNFIKKTETLTKFNERYGHKKSYLGHILTRNLSQKEHTLFIDLGSLHGVKKDMVAVYKNCLLGRVCQVYPLYSKVILITDSSCKVAAYCAKTKSNGVYKGTNCKDCSMLTHVSHLNDVEANDLLLSSGQSLIFPQGFALGRIKKITPKELFYHIEIEPLLDVNTIEYCYVMQKGKY